jgi:uncharacterized protein YlbG (UPF0298 family)
MIEYDLKRAKLAVQYLVSATFSAHHIRKIWTSVKKPRSMPFKDDMEHLNELIRIGRQSEQALKNLLELVEFKRDDAAAYMREFMRAKRRRDAKYLALWTLENGKKLDRDEQRQVLIEKYREWHVKKREFLEPYGMISYEERNALYKLFWTEMEKELDTKLEKVKDAFTSFSQKKSRNLHGGNYQTESFERIITKRKV